MAAAEELEGYLEAAEAAAAAAEAAALEADDTQYTPLWRETGLPEKASFLQLDPARLASSLGRSSKALDGGEPATSGAGPVPLVDPGRLWEMNLEERIESIAPPRLASRGASRRKEGAGYLKETNNVRVRQQYKPERKPKFILNGKELTQEELVGRAKEAEKRLKELSRKMTAAQWEQENKVLGRMRQRLNFLKNPRNLPPKGGARAAGKGGGGGGAGSGGAATVGGGGGVGGRRLLSASEMAFVVEPPIVEFTDYEVGKAYEMTIDLRNVSPVSRRVRLLPPASQFFSITHVKFPTTHGFVAPGLCCQCTVRFTPDSLADYDSHFEIETELNRFEVPLQARRPPPSLTIESTFNCGYCLVGNTSVLRVDCSNIGGPGRFRLVSEVDWPGRTAPREDMSVLLPPFNFRPAEFELLSGEQTTFEVAFTPQGTGQAVQQFKMVCDNCQVKTFTIVGTGTDVSIDVLGEDGAALAPHADVWFDRVEPGASFSRLFRIRNNTPLQLPFRWEQFLPAERLRVEGLGSPGKPAAAAAGTESEEDAVPADPGCPHFVIEPAEATLAAQDELEVSVTFQPEALQAYARILRLKVDRAVGGRSEDADFQVFEMNVEGSGKACEVTMEPPMIDFSGTMLLSKSYFREVNVHNQTATSTSFRWEGLDDCLKITPAEGVLQAHQSLEMDVSLLAEAVGPVDRTAMLVVDHGPVLPLRVRADVAGPVLSFAQANVDFGLVQRGCHAEATLTLVNKTDIPADWCLAERSAEPFLTFSETSGTLQPLETRDLALAALPTREAALRSVVTCEVVGGRAQHVAVRADVVSPRSCLDQSVIDLGTSYVNVPVERVVRQRNLTQLPAQYKWDDASGEAVGCSVSVSPPEGTIPPGGEEEFVVTITPLRVGALECIQACDVVGMENPMGLLLRSEVRGLAVTYEVRDTAGASQALPADGAAVLDFGEACPIRQRRTMTLVVRNDTAICVPVHAGLQRFAARSPTAPMAAPLASGGGGTSGPAGGSARTGSGAATARLRTGSSGTRSARTSTGPRSGRGSTELIPAGRSRRWRKGPLLSDQQDRLYPFSSQMGSRMMDERRDGELDTAMLGEGRGLALKAAPVYGILEPWGQWECQITCFSNMCGQYEDTLVCEVGSLPPREVAVRCGVVGTPLVVTKERGVVRNFPTAKKRGKNAAAGPIRLQFGELPCGSDPLERRFHVQNTSPFDMEVEWGVRGEPAEDAEEPVTVELVPWAGRDVQVLVDPRSDPESCPFRVAPERQVIRTGESAAVTVGFYSEEARRHCAYVTGTQRVLFDSDGEAEAEGHTGPPRFHPFAGPPPQPLEPLVVDLRATSIVPRLDTDNTEQLLFRCHSSDPLEHTSYRHTVVLSNLHNAPLSFCVRTQAPFCITNLAPSVAQDRAQADGGAFHEAVFELPPRENLNVEVQFEPPEGGLARGGAGATRGADGSQEQDPRFAGELMVYFTNDPKAAYNEVVTATHEEMLQSLPLVADYVVPRLTCSHDTVRFRQVHPGAPREIEVTLTNPTTADAEWEARLVMMDEHVRAGAGASEDGESTASRAGTEPTFCLQPAFGHIPGRGLGMPRTQKVTIAFTPQEEKPYEAAVVFTARRGRSITVDVSGAGSFAEALESDLALSLY